MFGKNSPFVRYDMQSSAYFNDPRQTFAAVQAAGPLAPVRLPFLGNHLMTTTHAASAMMLKSDDDFVRQPERAGLRKGVQMLWWMPPSLRALSDNLLGLDDPEHKRLRGAVDQAFARRDVAALEQNIVAQADALLAPLGAGDAVDIAAAFTRQLPLDVICDLLGLHGQDRVRATRYAENLASATGVFSLMRGVYGIGPLQRLIAAKFARLRDKPEAGLMSLMQQADDPIAERDQVVMVFLLFLAGHETTVHLINGAILTLCQRPDLREALTSDWSTLPLFMEEVLRHFAPVQMTKFRWAARDLEFCGQHLPRGTPISAYLACANRDPAKYEDPDVFDPTRKPNPHLSFGAGPHFCLGLMLARLEAQVALRRLFETYPNLGLADPEAAPNWRERFGMRALATLPLRL